MTRRGTLVTAGIAAFLVFLVAMVPARVLAGRLSPALALDGVGGTIWSGSAVQLRIQDRPFGALSWSCRPWRILLLEWSCRLTLSPEGGEIAGDVAAGIGGQWVGSDITGQVPIAAFEGIATPRGWTGLLEFDIERLRVADRRAGEMAGRVRVRALKAPGAGGDRLGDFELVIGEGSVGTDTLSGRLRDLGGPLRVRGIVELASDGRYLLSGDAAPGPGAGPSILDTLAFPGPPDSLGRRTFTIEGSL
jgi:general secretion pathway protein N